MTKPKASPVAVTPRYEEFDATAEARDAAEKQAKREARSQAGSAPEVVSE